MIVALWHPLGAPPDETARWRRVVMAERIVQPFAQAFRETYPLTDAERATATYSNRFAGHVLRQHVTLALARQRGWRAAMRIAADVRDPPPLHRRLEHAGLAVELDTIVRDSDYAAYTSGLGYTVLSTDRVRFRAITGELDHHGLGAVLPLETIPAQVFSEAMRDVDLLVGVASIGDDVSWADTGAEAPPWRDQTALDYWSSQIEGELGTPAIARRDFISMLLPSLDIADRCRIDERHLWVRGRLMSYRIHFGSGNITMEDGRYLCIVQKAAPRADLLLPFAEDTMTGLILAKAMMLAADDAIKDPAIVRQIQRS